MFIDLKEIFCRYSFTVRKGQGIPWIIKLGESKGGLESMFPRILAQSLECLLVGL